MKKAILLAAFIAAIAIAGYSCNWFDSSSGSSKDPFIGKWKVDSIHIEDSTSIRNLLASTSFDASADHHIEFGKDSVWVLTAEVREGSFYKVDETKKELSFEENSDPFTYEFISDGRVRLSGRDNTILHLRKK